MRRIGRCRVFRRAVAPRPAHRRGPRVARRRRRRSRLTQGAAGGDLLFAEACLARGVPLRLLLPLAEPEFMAASLLPAADGAGWLARFRAVVARLDAAPRSAPTSSVRGAGRRSVRSRQPWLLESALAFGAERLYCICLWDGGGGDRPGGTVISSAPPRCRRPHRPHRHARSDGRPPTGVAAHRRAVLQSRAASALARPPARTSMRAKRRGDGGPRSRENDLGKTESKAKKVARRRRCRCTSA